MELAKALAIEAVTHRGDTLQVLDSAYRDDKDVVLAAVQNQGSALRFASETLQADREVVSAAVQRSGDALEFASPALQADKEIVMAAVRESVNAGAALEFADAALKADREFVLMAVKAEGTALEHADGALRADKEVVSTAVMQNIFALSMASDEVLNDSRFVNDLLRALPASSMDDAQLFRVSLLSGKSCYCQVLYPQEYDDRDGEVDPVLHNLLMECSDRFGLDPDEVVSADLLDGTTPLSSDEALRGYACGKLHDLQLVVRPAKRQRLGDD